MKRVLVYTALILAYIGAVAIPRPRRNHEVAEFAHQVEGTIQDNNDAFGPLMLSIDKWYSGKTININHLEEKISALEAYHSAMLHQMKMISIPDDDHCRDYHQAMVDYLKLDGQLIGQYIKLVDYISINNPGLQVHFEFVNSKITPILADESRMLDRAYTSYALLVKDHNIYSSH